MCSFTEWNGWMNGWMDGAGAAMQYGQNISNYSQPQGEHNNMFSNDHKDNILKTKIERDREDGKVSCNYADDNSNLDFT